MNRIILIFLILFLFSCNSDNKKERFYKTYQQIIIARSEIKDSLKANAAVLQIIKQNGYTEKEFQIEFFELARTEKDFVRIIDSIRNSAKNDYQKIIDSTKSKEKKIEE